MFIVAIWVMALFLLGAGLYQLADVLYQADLYFWNYFTESQGELTKLIVDGRSVDPQAYLTERAIFGAALTLIGFGFLFIAYRVGSKTA